MKSLLICDKGNNIYANLGKIQWLVFELFEEKIIPIFWRPVRKKFY